MKSMDPDNGDNNNDDTIRDSVRSLRSRHDIATPTMSPVHHTTTGKPSSYMPSRQSKEHPGDDREFAERTPLEQRPGFASNGDGHHQLPGYNQSPHRLPASPDYHPRRITSDHHHHHHNQNSNSPSRGNVAPRTLSNRDVITGGGGHKGLASYNEELVRSTPGGGAAGDVPLAFHPQSSTATPGVIVIRLADKGEQYDVGDIDNAPLTLEATNRKVTRHLSDIYAGVIDEQVGVEEQYDENESALSSIATSQSNSESQATKTKSSSLSRESDQHTKSLSCNMTSANSTESRLDGTKSF